ncbi:DUF6473 family protein [Sulfitobacter sp. S223]|uniref:DUF6473 family protein n=1 Tax=Sulfitobacter sp. S223 TaxID=2867023 RepID=UPI0021A28F2F|nr:DUF6473 family protein [Sulfitobacter sp. S223]UWR26888.1 DUF6473 family protein [Sulfitobacter sp. S223]
MIYDVLGPVALDYLPCRYGTSKLIFRGPQRELKNPYIAFLGGTQTFGKFIEQPYPLRVEHLTGVASVNFGQMNAGLDVFASDPVIAEAAHGARVTVLEVLGAINLSNRLYSVHPRRNDRFLRTAPDLRALYPEVDFSQFNFTQHMLSDLFQRDSQRFATMRRILQRTWVRRMRQLIDRLGGHVVLLRIGNDAQDKICPVGQGFGPVLVSDDMIEEVRGAVSAIVDVPASLTDGPNRYDGMIVSAPEEEAAKVVAPARVHSAVAQALLPVLDQLI